MSSNEASSGSASSSLRTSSFGRPIVAILTASERPRPVQRRRGADQRLEGLLIDLLPLMEIDRPPGVAFEAGVEESCRVLERRALEERQLHDLLVRLAGADRAMVRPDRNASPLPLLDLLRDRLLDESADVGERPAPPVVQLLDPRVDQPGRGFALGRCALFHGVCTFVAIR